jgi:hypothetical protein
MNLDGGHSNFEYPNANPSIDALHDHPYIAPHHISHHPLNIHFSGVFAK